MKFKVPFYRRKGWRFLSPFHSPPPSSPPFELGNVAGFRTGRPEQQQEGYALQHCSEEMKGDRELCTAAVTQNGYALQHCSEEMKGDRELCTAAVAQKDGRVFEVMIDRRAGGKLGIDVDHVDGINLIIVNISDGLMRAWNDANPGMQVRVGYKISEINGVSGDVDDLVDACKGKTFLKMIIVASTDPIPRLPR